MTEDSKGASYYFAKAISYLFHPLLIPTIGLWFIFHTNSYIQFIITPKLQFALHIVVFIATFVFPVLSSVLLLFMGRISSLEMETTEERRLPYLLTAIYYSIGYYMLMSKIQLPAQISIMLLGATLSVGLTMLINLFWKVSAHAIGIGGLLGALLGFSYQVHINLLNESMTVTLIAGLIGYSRLKLKAHVPSQLYVGYLIGFLSEFLLFFFL